MLPDLPQDFHPFSPHSADVLALQSLPGFFRRKRRRCIALPHGCPLTPKDLAKDRPDPKQEAATSKK
jgi:hypothetical protein